MKNLTLILSLFFTTSLLANPLHLDLEMDSHEYQTLLKTKTFKSGDHPAIKQGILIGNRLSKWIELVNSGRTPETAIRLTSSATRRGIPIDSPSKYSPETIQTEIAAIKSEVPKEITDVLFGAADLPGTIPLDDETFIKHARRIDKNYQSAARYKSVDEYRVWYIEAATKDVRGFHYLTTNKIGENELRDVRAIPAGKFSEIKEALSLICLNSIKKMDKCSKSLEEAITANTVNLFYNEHMPDAKKNWDDFFKIQAGSRRKDILWNEYITTVPFNTPEIPKFESYLKDNIEAEFQWGSWSMKINFGNYRNGPYLRFEAGVVPHVNALGGNEIVMDSNQPIEEYESQWIIRHEFGHVLGLPDCYHEFYDVKARAYVNYQLDITDLMCSRAGNMKERIYTELKGAYSR